MKKTILTCFWLLINFLLHSSSPNSNFTIPSLENLNNDLLGKNTELSRAFFEVAYIYYEQEKWPLAEKFIKKSLHFGNCDWEAFSMLGVIYYIQGDIKQAEIIFKQSEALSKNSLQEETWCAYPLAVLYEVQGTITSATEYLQEEMNKDASETLFTLAKTCREMKKFDLAVKYFNQSVQEGHTSALSVLASMYEKTGQLDQATAIYRNISNDTFALKKLGRIHCKQKKFYEAHASYLHASLPGNDADVSNEMGVLFYQQNNIKCAKSYFKKAATNGKIEALYNLAALYKELGEKDKEKYYIKCANKKGGIRALYLSDIDFLNPVAISKYKEAEAFRQVGEIYFLQDNIKKGKKYCDLALKLGSCEALVNLGDIYVSLAQPDCAEKYYQKAIHKGSTHGAVRLGFLYTKQKKFDCAAEIYKQAIDEGNREGQYYLGNMYSELDKKDLAKKHYQLAANKYHFNAILKLAAIYLDENDTESAISILEKAAYLNDAPAITFLGEIYYNLKQIKLAKKHFKKVIADESLLNNNYKIQNIALCGLGIIYKQQNNHQKAIEYFRCAANNGDAEAILEVMKIT